MCKQSYKAMLVGFIGTIWRARRSNLFVLDAFFISGIVVPRNVFCYNLVPLADKNLLPPPQKCHNCKRQTVMDGFSFPDHQSKETGEVRAV